MEYIWIVVGGIVLATIIGAVTAGSKVSSLQRSFASMGDMTGKTKADVIRQVGPPQTISALPEGGSLLQWQIINQAGGYHIAIAFDADEKFIGITHEHAA